MDKKRIIIVIVLLFLLILGPFIAVVGVNKVTIKDKSLKRIEVTVLDVRVTEQGYSIKIGYDLDSYHERRIISDHEYQKGQKIDAFYYEKDHDDVLLTSKRNLTYAEKRNIYCIFALVMTILLVFMIWKYNYELSSVVRLFSNKVSTDDALHHEGHHLVKRRNDEFITIMGKIVKCYQKNNNHYIDIEYVYDNAVYEFTVALNKRVTNLDMVGHSIEVYIKDNAPEIARIDEEELIKLHN